MKPLLTPKNLKRVFFALSLVLISSFSFAQNQATDDRFVIEDATVTTNGATKNFIVSFEGSRTYIAYNVDIVLPNDLFIATKSNGSPRISMYTGTGHPYPYEIEEVEDEETGELVEQKSYYHTLESSNPAENTYRVLCYTVSKENFTNQSGKLFRVYVSATPYTKPGVASITIKNCNFTESVWLDETNFEVTKYVPADYVSTALTVSGESSVAVKVSSTNKYGTLVLPFDTAIPDGLVVYSCRSTNGEYLVLEKQESIAAYTPYIIYAENGFDYTFSGTATEENYLARVNNGVVTDGYLSGAIRLQELTAGEGHYVMQNQNQGEGVMFYNVGETPFSMKPGKCWLTLPAELQGSVAFRLDGATGIDEMTEQRAESKEIYDLTGRKVENITAPGIYIIGGKKVLVK